MTPETQDLLDMLPMTREQFVRLRSEEVLRNMLRVGAIREFQGRIELSPFGAARLSIAKQQRKTEKG